MANHPVQSVTVRGKVLQLTRTQSLPFEVVVKEHRVVPARPVQGQLQDSDQHGQRVAVRNTMQPAGRENHKYEEIAPGISNSPIVW